MVPKINNPKLKNMLFARILRQKKHVEYNVSHYNSNPRICRNKSKIHTDLQAGFSKKMCLSDK